MGAKRGCKEEKPSNCKNGPIPVIRGDLRHTSDRRCDRNYVFNEGNGPPSPTRETCSTKLDKPSLQNEKGGRRRFVKGKERH